MNAKQMNAKQKSVENTSSGQPENPQRRQFLKSIFGLGGAVEVAQAEPVHAKAGGLFFWADLKNGNMGFPSGLKVPSARPGSVMKLITAACILEEGAFNPNEKEECTGTFTISQEDFHCAHPHGKVTIEEAIAKSCNIFFVKATRRVGPGSIIEYARMFGLDTPVAGFKGGAFPTKPVHPTSYYAIGLAEDLRPNALQLLRLAAIFGTDGHVPVLRNAAALDVVENIGAQDDKPWTVALKETTFKRIRKGMIMAVSDGTAQHLDPDHKLRIAAKTGTVPYGKKFESWVIGFFPNDKPAENARLHAFCLYAPVGTSHDSAIPQAREKLLSVQWPE